MDSLLKFVINLLLIFFVVNSYAANSSAKNNCASCHGLTGSGIIASYPKLAGQNEKYFIRQMLAFKTKQRNNPLMQSLAQALSDEDLQQLASFYAKQIISSGTAKRSLATRGQLLYRAGDKYRSIPACMACHGPAGEGNKLAGTPGLAGQYAAYTEAQLSAYQTNTRTTDVQHIMRDIASRLSNDDIAALASYIEGLHSKS